MSQPGSRCGVTTDVHPGVLITLHANDDEPQLHLTSALTLHNNALSILLYEHFFKILMDSRLTVLQD